MKSRKLLICRWFKSAKQRTLSLTLVLIATAGALICSSCTKDDPGNGPDKNNTSITIGANGECSNGSTFSKVDNNTFFIDYIKYKIVDGHLEVIGYDPEGEIKNATIYGKVTVDGATYETKIILHNAFEDCKTLNSIILPSTITKIGKRAFAICSSLKDITLPSVTYIGEDAFVYCENLSKASLPAATNIGEEAFSGCKSLSEISLPAAAYIGYGAFCGCKNLSEISLPAATDIDNFAFAICENLSKISLPAATYIGMYAFRACETLSEISLPASIEHLSPHAFSESRLSVIRCYAPEPPYTGQYSDLYDCKNITLYVPKNSVHKYQDVWGDSFETIIGNL